MAKIPLNWEIRFKLSRGEDCGHYVLVLFSFQEMPLQGQLLGRGELANDRIRPKKDIGDLYCRTLTCGDHFCHEKECFWLLDLAVTEIVNLACEIGKSKPFVIEIGRQRPDWADEPEK